MTNKKCRLICHYFEYKYSKIKCVNNPPKMQSTLSTLLPILYQNSNELTAPEKSEILSVTFWIKIEFRKNERGSERWISLLRLEFFSQHQKWLLSWSQLRHHNVENGFLVDHHIEKTEKNIEKISFVWFSHFDYLWRKYLWHFGANKNFLTWLNLT